MRVTKTYDDLLELKAAGLVASSDHSHDSAGTRIILDLGTGDVEGDIIIDVTACEVDSGNEIYEIGAQISDSSTMGSGIYEVCTLKLGDAVAIPGDTDMGIGRYVLPFQNRIVNGTAKRYLQIYTTVTGTIGTGINFAAYLAKK